MSAEEAPSTDPVPVPDGPFEWHRVLDTDGLPDGRVTTVSVGRRTLAVSHYEGGYAAIDNRCPHQGGPLGEGSIEKGWLRCPWHGYDYSPCNGRPPGGHDDDVNAFCVDVGNNTYSFGRYFEVADQSVLMSGYLGSIGFGFPAAMGAWAAIGDRRQIIGVSGDAGFGQYATDDHRGQVPHEHHPRRDEQR